MLLDGNPRMYMQLVVGDNQGLIKVLERKLARLIQRVPTLHIEKIPAIMQELVVGIPPTWIRLMRRVAREMLVYIEDAEVAAAEEAEDAKE